MDVETLEDKLDNITMGDVGFDLLVILVSFFSDKTIQARMVALNQVQLYHAGILADGSPTPAYKASTLLKRKTHGMSITPPNYHYHEYGDLFDSMGVLVEEDRATIISGIADASIPLGIDIAGGSLRGDTGHIEYFFKNYDPNREGLGLTEENLLTLREDMVDEVQERLKEYLLNG